MRKKMWLSLVAAFMVVILVGCGEKSQEDVLNDVDKALEETTSYTSKATMQLATGQEPQTYDVEVMQKDQSYYKVDLKNKTNDQSQIILKNDEGVFVLTPALNKVFRFQSDWPKTSSQAYLYESLLKDISLGADMEFSQDDDFYIFKTATMYQNKNLNSQEIRLHKKDLKPASVKIMDADEKVLVDLTFTEFEKNPTVAAEEFETEKVMTGAQMSEPTMADPEEELNEEFRIYYPEFVPDGVNDQPEEDQVETGDRTTFVQQYTGEKSFTLIQEQAQVVPASTPQNLVSAKVVDLGFAVGIQVNDTIMWSHNGSDFSLLSQDMEMDELIEVARSVVAVGEK
ncbi:LolA family protein [Shouchella hunanensis]|uniref:Outer membrane lipoprotein carrier protein LolA n=1 Tax=Shouchella hunanensis TaxID=766894 RepID=A0ABY7WD67_9BACI|nr:outer membrane lipoprotein carrier protein LolA [Shouchella hunanensis]WDF04590.1 outer membrane lipoprotein carrier protein LolA [Shouchella hunanensis]